MLRGGGLSREAATHYVARMQEPGALSRRLGWYRAMPHGIRDRVGTVRVPTLHMWSTGDTFLGRAGIEATARFVDAPYRLEILDDVSHWIPELAADRVAELVTAHVRPPDGPEPGGQRVLEGPTSPLAHPRHVPVGSDQHGRGSADRTDHRQLPRAVVRASTDAPGPATAPVDAARLRG